MPKLNSEKQKHGLIAAVRSQKSLYDPKKVNLKSNNGVWNQVAAQCGMKRGQVAKLTWKKMLDAYSAYLENPDKNPNKTYCMFFKQMEFIDPYLTKHKKNDKTFVPDCKVNTETEVETSENIDDVESVDMNETLQNREFSTIQYWNDTKDESESATELETTNSTIQQTKEACSELNSDSEIESYEDVILPDALAVSNGTIIDNSLKMFFDAMFASTNQLPAVFQRIVKRKIFSAVLEAEEEAEKQNQSVMG